MSIVGRSGSGKSTLINILSGLDTPAKGIVELENKNIFDLSDRDRTILRRKEIGFIFQSYNLIPVLTVKEKRKTITIVCILSITLASFIINQSIDNMKKVRIYNAEEEYGTGGPHSTILIDMTSLINLTKTDGYDRFDIWLDNKDDLNTIISIKNIKEIDRKAEITTYEEAVSMLIEQSKKEQIIGLIFAIIFIVISLVNCFNTILNNIINRQNEILTLNTIGLTRSEITLSNMIEGLSYGLISAMVTGLIQIIIIGLDYYVNEGIFFYKEIIYIFVLLDIFIIIICLLFSFVSIYYVFKTSNES